MKTGQVFVSHTSDMALFPEGRSFVQAALDGVGRAGMAPVDMRYFAAREGEPAEYCRARVRGCEIYVAVIGFRYGAGVPGESVSYTDLEFREAAAAGLPRLVFLLAPAADVPAGLADADRRAVEGFRHRSRDAGVVVREFTSADGLELEVFHALTEVANVIGDGPTASGAGDSPPNLAEDLQPARKPPPITAAVNNPAGAQVGNNNTQVNNLYYSAPQRRPRPGLLAASATAVLVVVGLGLAMLFTASPHHPTTHQSSPLTAAAVQKALLDSSDMGALESVGGPLHQSDVQLPGLSGHDPPGCSNDIAYPTYTESRDFSDGLYLSFGEVIYAYRSQGDADMGYEIYAKSISCAIKSSTSATNHIAGICDADSAVETHVHYANVGATLTFYLAIIRCGRYSMLTAMATPLSGPDTWQEFTLYVQIAARKVNSLPGA